VVSGKKFHLIGTLGVKSWKFPVLFLIIGKKLIIYLLRMSINIYATSALKKSIPLFTVILKGIKPYRLDICTKYEFFLFMLK